MKYPSMPSTSRIAWRLRNPVDVFDLCDHQHVLCGTVAVCIKPTPICLRSGQAHPAASARGVVDSVDDPSPPLLLC